MNLPLFPNQQFADGEDWTPALGYLSMYSPVFDGRTEYLGHREKIRDDELSDAAGSLKQRVQQSESSLKVSVEGGLLLRYQSGLVRLADGDLLSISSGLITAPDNAIGYVYITPAGGIACDRSPSTTRLMLAKVTTVSGQVSQLVDLRDNSIRAIAPNAATVKSFGGSNGLDKVVAQGEVFDAGVYYFRNFVVPEGVTCTVLQYAKIFCSGYVEIRGTVNVTPMPSGASFQPYVLNRLGTTGQSVGFGLGNRGIPYPWGAQPYGSGGQQGSLISIGLDQSWGFTWEGGNGGGCFWIEAYDRIEIAPTGAVFVDGGNGGRGGTNPNNVQGAVSVGVFASISGTGGGSGGMIYLSSSRSVTVRSGATLSVRGGNGGDGFVYTSDLGFAAFGGHAGGGGNVVLSSPANNATGANILLSGGRNGVPQGMDQVADSVWRLAGARLVTGGGSGGAFAGTPGTHTLSYPGGIFTMTSIHGSAGKLVVRDYAPIGG